MAQKPSGVAYVHSEHRMTGGQRRETDGTLVPTSITTFDLLHLQKQMLLFGLIILHIWMDISLQSVKQSILLPFAWF